MRTRDEIILYLKGYFDKQGTLYKDVEIEKLADNLIQKYILGETLSFTEKDALDLTINWKRIKISDYPFGSVSGIVCEN